jgi:iron complex outermembrane receptor protein
METRFDVDLGVIPPTPSTPPVLVGVQSNPDLGVEEVFAYELGYRVRPHKRLSLDAAGFVNDFHGLRAWTDDPLQFSGTPAPHVIATTTASDAKSGLSYGAELSMDWAVTDHWRLHASYSWIQFDLDWPGPSPTATPEQQFQLRSHLDLPHNIELIGAAYYVDQVIPDNGIFNVPIDSYIRLDLGVTWRPHKSLELGIWGQNLADSGHPEFTSYRTREVAEVPRSVVGRVTWSY